MAAVFCFLFVPLSELGSAEGDAPSLSDSVFACLRPLASSTGARKVLGVESLLAAKLLAPFRRLLTGGCCDPEVDSSCWYISSAYASDIHNKY